MTREDQIPGYSYGSHALQTSPVSLYDLQLLKVSVGLTPADECSLRQAGEVLKDQTSQIVAHWRSGIIAGIPHLARHSRALDGGAIPQYLERTNLRFQQWIWDTCFRPYDQDWLNYQHEIALRHTSLKKNQTDGVESTRYVPLDDIIAFAATMNETIKPFLAAKGHSAQAVNQMHQAWCKSLQLQLALWTHAFFDSAK
jgi:hypothetical protein